MSRWGTARLPNDLHKTRRDDHMADARIEAVARYVNRGDWARSLHCNSRWSHCISYFMHELATGEDIYRAACGVMVRNPNRYAPKPPCPKCLKQAWVLQSDAAREAFLEAVLADAPVMSAEAPKEKPLIESMNTESDRAAAGEYGTGTE